MLQSHRMRWGGDLRRSHLFRALARRTEATVLDGWGRRALRREFGLLRILPTPIRHLRSRPMPRLASSEMIHSRYLRMALRVLDPAVVAVYDDAVAQTASLGMTMSPDRRALFTSRRDDNLATFRWHAVPTASFAEMIGLDPATTLVAGNGTNAAHIRPGPWPERPAIGMVSGAAPGRGMETLIAAARGLRAQLPDLQLLLWLVPTGPESEDYLEGLRAATAKEEWIRIDTVDYERIGDSLAHATVLTVPHPPDAYMDVALPVKLFDSMAAGRPLVVTPRTETRAVVERHGAGVVTAGDTTDDLAGALLGVLEDQAAARRMGAAARLAAEQHYDWSVVGERIADLVIEREGGR